MPATLNRKNNGKQFTVVDQETRSILHWHRPGDPLPFVVDRSLWGESNYLVTQDDVDSAQINKRVNLKLIDVNWEYIEANEEKLSVPGHSISMYTGFEGDTVSDYYMNGKGSDIAVLTKAKSKVNAALWALSGIVGVAAVAVGYEMTKVFA